MWAFKTLWDKGLIYSGFRVLWYCWHDGTPLSTTETRMDDVYRERQDPAVTVGLRLRAPGPDLDGALALVWTTTPWTLPSNLAMAVNPAVEYALVRSAAGERYVLAAARVGALRARARLGRGRRARVLRTMPGSELVGLSYVPPFDFFEGRENAHRMLAADYVTTDDGTGLVHIAPAFGEEDKVVTDAAGIETVVPVDARGKFDTQVAPYAGMQVFDANQTIIRDLSDGARYVNGVLLRHETYDHPYPHCWRCGNPLITARGRLVVRTGHGVPRPHGRAEPGDHLGARPRPRRRSSASGWRTPTTGRSPVTATGARRSRCGCPTTRSIRASTSTARSTSWSATSVCVRTTCTARTSTS